MDWHIWEALTGGPLVAALAAQFSSQLVKVFLPVFQGKAPAFSKIADYGGIPSAHTAFITGVTVAIGLKCGWKSDILALAVVVSAILIYDIIKMRKAVEISLELSQKAAQQANIPVPQKIPQFKGHSLLEVVAGGLWGALWAVLIIFIWPK